MICGVILIRVLKVILSDAWTDFGDKKSWIYVCIGVIVGVVLFIVISITVLLFIRRTRKSSSTSETAALLASFESENNISSIGKKHWDIPYQELKIQQQIGEGGFGVVYKVSQRINILV